MSKLPSDSRIRTDALEIQIAVMVCVCSLKLHTVEEIDAQLGVGARRLSYALKQLTDKGYLCCGPDPYTDPSVGNPPIAYRLAMGYRREAQALGFERRGVAVDRSAALPRLRELVRRRIDDHENRRPLSGESDALWKSTVLNLPRFHADGSLVDIWDWLHRLVGKSSK